MKIPVNPLRRRRSVHTHSGNRTIGEASSYADIGDPVFRWYPKALGNNYAGVTGAPTLVGDPTLGATGYTFATGKYATHPSAGLFSLSAGTLFTEIIPTGVLAAGSSIFDVRSNTNVGPQAIVASTSLRWFWQGTAKAIGGFTFSASTRYYVALTWALNGSALYDLATYAWASGIPAALATSTDGAALGALSATAYIGANTGGAAPLEAACGRFLIFDKALTPAQLAALV